MAVAVMLILTLSAISQLASAQRCPTISPVSCAPGCRLSTDDNGCNICFCSTTLAPSTADACLSMKCEDGHVCQLVQVWCITDPCPPQPACVSLVPSTTTTTTTTEAGTSATKPWGCLLPPDYGISCLPTNATRWYFDSTSGHCETFTFGGCSGNRNNFPSSELCRLVCSDSVPTLAATSSLLSSSISPSASSSPCPAINCASRQCAASGFMTDESGCTVCHCVDPCEEIRCPSNTTCHSYGTASRSVFCTDSVTPTYVSFFVPVAYQTDNCPLVRCSTSCVAGQMLDENGCPSCQCITPCQLMVCPLGCNVALDFPLQPRCIDDECFVPYSATCSGSAGPWTVSTSPVASYQSTNIGSVSSLSATSMSSASSNVASTSTPNSAENRFKSCCAASELSLVCQNFCTYDANALNAAMGLYLPQCINSIRSILQCLTGGVSQTSCCQGQGVSDDCIDFCSGRQTSETDVISCVQYVPKLLTCYGDSSSATVSSTLERLSLPTFVSSTFSSATAMSASPSDEDRFRSCCVSGGVSLKCQQLCTFNLGILSVVSLSLLEECASYFDAGVMCANGGVDRTICCNERGVTHSCLGMCSGLVSQIPTNSTACWPNFLAALSCYSSVEYPSTSTSMPTPSTAASSSVISVQPSSPSQTNAESRYRDCCISYGVSSACQQLCTYNTKSLQNSSSLLLYDCAIYFNIAVQCASGGINKTDCCNNRGIDESCIGLCSGSMFQIPADRQACLPYFTTALSCYADVDLTSTTTSLPPSPTTTICPSISCVFDCIYGFDTDKSGCTVCQCYDPCKDVFCADGTVCEPYALNPPVFVGGPGGTRRVYSTQCVPTTTTTTQSTSRAVTSSGCSPVICLMFCPYGFARDAVTGCPVCTCRDPCQGVSCPANTVCLVGDMREDGSYSVQCAELFTTTSATRTPTTTSDCSQVMCAMYCEFGFTRDPANGCPTCHCFEPCKDVNCVAPTTCVPVLNGDSWIGRCSVPSTTTPSITEQPTSTIGCSRVMCAMFCDYGFARDPANDCPICRCFEPCQDVYCVAPATCLPTLNGDSWIGRCSDAISTSPTRTTPKLCATPICQTFCQYGYGKDENGCPTCGCVEPCQGATCPLNADCRPHNTKLNVYVGNCIPSSGVLVNGILTVYTDYGLVHQVADFKDQLANEIQVVLLQTRQYTVNINKLEPGSIIVSFSVVAYTNVTAEEVYHRLSHITGWVTFELGGGYYDAMLGDYWIQPQNATTTETGSSSNYLLLVVLIPVIVPISLLVIVIVIVVTCKTYRSDHDVLKSSRSSLSGDSTSTDHYFLHDNEKGDCTKSLDNLFYIQVSAPETKTNYDNGSSYA